MEYWQWWLHLKARDGHQYGAVLVFYEFPLSSALDGAGFGLRRTDVRLTDLTDGSSQDLAQRWTEEQLRDFRFTRLTGTRGEVLVSRAAQDMLTPVHASA